MNVPLESAGDELQVRIDDPHLLGGVTRLAPYSRAWSWPNLPRPVHLVAETPVADVVRPIVAVDGSARSSGCRVRGCSYST